MANIKDWISAFRLRTLFLAVGTVVLGAGMALHKGEFNTTAFVLTFILAVAIQILANLANDLGDFQKGTDTTGRRQGPVRAVQSGMISPRSMKAAIVVFSLICAITGLLLIMRILPHINKAAALTLLAIGVACILAALFYTLGKHAYGYKGWGDFFAFLFFGPIPVVGAYFFHTYSFDLQPIYPSIGMGFISTMILNVNNMRDIKNDKESGKKTIAVKLGLRNARIYHALLTLGTFVCFILYSSLYAPIPWYRYLYAVVFLFQLKILQSIFEKEDRALDPYLKLTSMSGFLLSIAFSLCINL